MSVIIVLVGNNIQENKEEEEKLPGEDWMYNDDVNSGLY